MTACQTYQEQISAWIDGELDKSQRAELTAHLRTCRACSETYRAYRNLSALLSEAVEAPPADLTARIMDRVRAESIPYEVPAAAESEAAEGAPAITPIQAARPRRKKRSAIAPLFAAAACLAVIVGVISFVGPARFASTAPASMSLSQQTENAPKAEDTEELTEEDLANAENVRNVPDLENADTAAALSMSADEDLSPAVVRQIRALLEDELEAKAPARNAEPVCTITDTDDDGEDRITTIWIDGDDLIYTENETDYFRVKDAADALLDLL